MLNSYKSEKQGKVVFLQFMAPQIAENPDNAEPQKSHGSCVQNYGYH
jgi:hypothetical protein